jgi:EAL and modified HD-GYP domain-containing signal transduction protein
MQTNRSSIIQLLALVSNSTIDYDELDAVVSLDPGISFKLLRFLNSAHFSLESRISNLRQALVFLGHKEIKKFIALVALASLGDSNQNDAITLAATRANFCDALAEKIDDESIQHSAFLVGLFSMIDTLLLDTMENILNLIPVDDSIREALLNNQGIGAELLNLTKCFEQADWPGISASSKRFGVSEEEIIACYQNAGRAASRLIPAMVRTS